MPNVLVLANETIGGEKLLDAIRERARQGDAQLPRRRPAARARGTATSSTTRRCATARRCAWTWRSRSCATTGIEGSGEVGDADPFNAAMDASPPSGIDEIIVSTLPAASSGWLRRDLPERLREETGLPVEHVVVDLADEGLPFDVTLVVANQTAAGAELIERLKAARRGGPAPLHRRRAAGPRARATRSREARERLSELLDSLREAGIVAAGHDRRPGPVHGGHERRRSTSTSPRSSISTLPEGSSKWVADKLVERVESATNKPVEHIESAPEPPGAEA